MAELLELSDQKFKATTINMLKALMKRVDSMQEQLGNIIRQMETLRRNKKEIQDTKKHCSRNKQKNASHGLPNTLDTANKRSVRLKTCQ